MYVITPLHGSLGTVKPLWDMSRDRQTGRQSWENRRGRARKEGRRSHHSDKAFHKISGLCEIGPVRHITPSPSTDRKKQPLKQVRYFNIIMRWQRPEPHSIDGICRIDSDKRLIFEPRAMTRCAEKPSIYFHRPFDKLWSNVASKFSSWNVYYVLLLYNCKSCTSYLGQRTTTFN